MPYIAPEVILEAKQIDLLSYLRAREPGQLVRLSGSVYCTKEHDSLKISNGKWMWWSRGIGGKSALDYLIKVQGYRFLDAVQEVLGNDFSSRTENEFASHKGKPNELHSKTLNALEETTGYSKEYTAETKEAETPLLLPEKSRSSDKVISYLFNRGIDLEIINYCLREGFIYESLPYHNVVFVGLNEQGEPKYAAYRATNEQRIMGDCSGSKKEYSFRLADGNGKEMHLFECAIDLLSYATLMKMDGRDWQDGNLISLSGVYQPRKNIAESKVPVALEIFLDKHPNISRIVLHLDNDMAGRRTTEALKTVLPKRYEVVDEPPGYGKDVNDFLCHELGIVRNKPRERSHER